MATVTGNVLTWGLAPYGTDERLVLEFVPSSSAVVVNSIRPSRQESVIPDSSGNFTVTLASTTEAVPDIWYEVQAAWFYKPPYEDWTFVRRSEIPGKLRVPPGGGDISVLLQREPVPGSIVVEDGPPPRVDTRVWIDWSDVTSEGVRVYAPEGTV